MNAGNVTRGMIITHGRNGDAAAITSCLFVSAESNILLLTRYRSEKTILRAPAQRKVIFIILRRRAILLAPRNFPVSASALYANPSRKYEKMVKN